MSKTDRLHALDGVRAWALILGIFLHATMPYLAGIPEGYWVWIEPPSTALAGLFWFIHLFRMSAFFLIAGLFARMVVERRGAKAFVKDRAKRIGIPLVAGLPIILITIIAAAAGGAMLVGIDPQSLMGAAATPEGQPAEVPDGYFPWGHLWFLYYLLVFYCLILVTRTIVHRFDGGEWLRGVLDRIVRFTFSGPWGAIVPAVPIGIQLYFNEEWIAWFGLPAPFLIWPEVASIVGYGVPFALGWLVHRQLDLILSLGRQWRRLLITSAALALGAYIIAGPTPNFATDQFAGLERLIYIALFLFAQWCVILAFIAIAVRFWSNESPLRHYVADSSYWLYLFHITTLAFIQVVTGPLEWHWAIKYTISITFTLPLLFLSYHYLVRATWLGALLNGRRRPRQFLSSRAQLS